jgi:hypothetical protein
MFSNFIAIRVNIETIRASFLFSSISNPFDYESEHRFTEHEHEANQSPNETLYPAKIAE